MVSPDEAIHNAKRDTDETTNKKKYQYSLRLERPLKTAYFFNASMNQLIRCLLLSSVG
jgi:hypothetical protein